MQFRAAMFCLLLSSFIAVEAWGGTAQGILNWKNWWLTADQQGQRLFTREEYKQAAEVFTDPWRQGVALYRAGEFEQAAAVFGRMRSPEGAFNRGNALLMLGQYEAAMVSYEQALKLRPAWSEAQENLDLARMRKERLAPPDSDDGGTGGMLEADEIVFDESGRVNKSTQEEVTSGGESMSDEEMRAVWLRRVQGKPSDFLRARFAYQLYRTQQEQSGE